MWFMRDFVVRALLWALHIFMTEKEKDMMAMLFAQRVILGKTEFAAVPAKLKAQVAVILIDECGLPELVPVEFGGTMGAGA